MLQQHFAAEEAHLLAISRIPANSGHSLHKGTPPGEVRNQFDLILYRREYPRLDFGGGINAFLAESVVATIEVKSTLDKDGVRQAVSAASKAKSYERHLVRAFEVGYHPPAILNYVVAYDGPARMETVRNWVLDSEIHWAGAPEA